MQRPISNVDFFSVKDSGNNEVHSPHGNNESDQVRDFFEQEHMSQHQQQSRAASWPVNANPWAANSGQSNQPQMSYHGAYISDGANAGNFIPRKAYSSGIFGNTLSSSPILNNDVGATSLHPFLRTAGDPSDSRAPSQMVLGLKTPQATVIKSQPRSQPLDFEGLLHGPTMNQLKASHVMPYDSSSLPVRQVGEVKNLGSQDAMQGLMLNHNVRFEGQSLEGSKQMEAPLSYDFLGSQPIVKAQGQGAAVQQSAGIGKQQGHGDMRTWQQSLYLQQLQDPHYQQQVQQFKQHSQHSKEQQIQQFFLSQRQQNKEISYSSLLHGSPPQEYTESMQTGILQTPAGFESHGASFFPNVNPAGSGWSWNGSSFVQQGVSNDVFMGQDQNLGWQIVALKGSQLDPSLYGTFMGNGRDCAGQMVPSYPGSQLESDGAAGKLSMNTPGKLVSRSLPSAPSIVADGPPDFFGMSDARNDVAGSKQAFGKPLFGSQQSLAHPAEHNQMVRNLHQMNQPSRGHQRFDNDPVKRQRNWSDSGEEGDSHFQNITHTSNAEETLPQSFLNSYSAHQSIWQNANPQQPVNSLDARSSRVEGMQLLHQNCHQTGNSQFQGASGSKQPSGWSTLQAGSSLGNCDGERQQQQVDAWNMLHLHQSQTEIGNALELLPSAKQSIWHNNDIHQSSPIPESAFHLVNESDGCQVGIHNTFNQQQGNSKAGGSLPDAVAGNGLGVNQTSFNSFADFRSRQDGGWKQDIVQDEVTNSGNAMQPVMEVDDQPQSSWKSCIAHQSTAATGASLLHSNTWNHDLQPLNSEARTSFRVLDSSSGKHDSWFRQDLQGSQQIENRLLAHVDTGHKAALLRKQKTVNFVAGTGESSKTVPNIDKEAGLSHTLLSDHAGKKIIGADLNLHQKQLHGGLFPQNVETDARQSENQSGFIQANYEWAGHAFQSMPTFAGNVPLLRDTFLSQGSPVERMSTGESEMADGNHTCQAVAGSPHVGHADVFHQSTRSGQDSPASSHHTEEDIYLRSFNNPNVRSHSRLRNLNTNLTTISSDEFPADGTFSQAGAALAPQWNLQIKESAAVEGPLNSEVHMVKETYGADMEQAKLSGENVHPYRFLNHGKDFPYPNSQVAFTPSKDTNFLRGVSVSGLVSAGHPMSNRSVALSDFNTGSGNKASALSCTLELLKKPGRSIEDLVLQSQVEEQRGNLDHVEASASDTSLAHFRHSHTSSPLSPQSFGLGLAPPSHLSQAPQQGCSAKSGNYMNGKEFSDDVSKHQVFEVELGCNENHAQKASVERAEVNEGGGNGTSVYKAVSQNSFETVADQTCSFPSLILKDVKPDHPPSSNFSGERFFLGRGKDVQSAGSTFFMMPFHDAKAAGALHREFEGLSSAMQSSQTGFESHGFLQNKYLADQMAVQSSLSGSHPLPTQFRRNEQNATEQPIINMTLSQPGDSQAADFSRLLTSFKNSVSSQQRLPIGHQKTFSGVSESLHPPPSFNSGSAAQFKSDAQFNLGKPSNAGKILATGSNQLFFPSSASHTILGQVANQSRFHQEQSSKKIVTNAFSLPQGFGTSSFQALGAIKGQEELRSSLVQNHHSHFKASTLLSQQQLATQVQEAKKFSSEITVPFSIPQGRPGQQQTDTSSEGLSVSQTSESLSHSDIVPSSEPAVRASSKEAASRKPSKNKSKAGSVNNKKMNSKGKLGQHPHAHVGMGQSKAFSKVDGMQQRTAATVSSLKTLQNPLQAVDMSTHGCNHLQNQTLNNFLDSTSQIYSMAKGILPTYGNGESTPSLVYGLKNISNQLPPSQAKILKNPSPIGGNQVTSSQHFLGKISDRFLSGASASSRFTGGVAGAFLKEGEYRSAVQSTSVAMEHVSRLESNLWAPGMVLQKKRKNVVLPWHVAITQPGQLVSTRGAEFMWATATNRIAEKEEEEADAQDDGTMSVFRAKRRLKFSSQLMQQLLLPLPAALLQGNTAADYECAVYTFAKIALGDACRLASSEAKHAIQKGVNSNSMALGLHQKSEPSNGTREDTMTNLIEGFTGKARRLEDHLLRLEGSISAMELKCETSDLEKLSTVNRLAKHHKKGFSLEIFESSIEEAPSVLGPGICRTFPQKYVTAVPMPRTLPEGVTCFSL